MFQINIQILIHYPNPPHFQGAYVDLNFKEGMFPISEKLHKQIISLPIGPHLLKNEYNFIIEKLNNFFR